MFTYDKMIESKVSIFTIVTIVQIVSFAKSEIIAKVDLNPSVAQLVKARDDLEKIVESLESKQFSVLLVKSKFTPIRGDWELGLESTSDSLNIAIGDLENRIGDIENSTTIGRQIIRNRVVKAIDDLIQVMSINSDSSTLDERSIEPILYRSIAQLVKAYDDLKEVMGNLKLNQKAIQKIKNSLKQSPLKQLGGK